MVSSMEITKQPYFGVFAGNASAPSGAETKYWQALAEGKVLSQEHLQEMTARVVQLEEEMEKQPGNQTLKLLYLQYSLIVQQNLFALEQAFSAPNASGSDNAEKPSPSKGKDSVDDE